MARFTIRVYGLLRDQGRVLVADEVVRGQRITKFPGGGLEYGEGPRDTLVREIHEELGMEALALEHFYTTDHFQRSAFHVEEVQVLAIYYTFRVEDPSAIRMDGGPATGANAIERFRWLDLHTATAEAVSLPIDRVVLRMLIEGRP